jgi:hypothetical protein
LLNVQVFPSIFDGSPLAPRLAIFYEAIIISFKSNSKRCGPLIILGPGDNAARRLLQNYKLLNYLFAEFAANSIPPVQFRFLFAEAKSASLTLQSHSQLMKVTLGALAGVCLLPVMNMSKLKSNSNVWGEIMDQNSNRKTN